MKIFVNGEFITDTSNYEWHKFFIFDGHIKMAGRHGPCSGWLNICKIMSLDKGDEILHTLKCSKDDVNLSKGVENVSDEYQGGLY